jgi:Zn-dependent peptidase ImmA (M78 family)
MENLDLYQIAERKGIEVYSHKMEGGSSSVMVCGECCIAIDPCAFENSDIERVHLAHELGHCVTGSFYNPYSKLDIREKHERRANAWAFKQIVPLDEIRKCFKQGLTEPWQMEDVFDVPAWFIRQAMDYYTNVCPLGAQ